MEHCHSKGIIHRGACSGWLRHDAGARYRAPLQQLPRHGAFVAVQALISRPVHMCYEIRLCSAHPQDNCPAPSALQTSSPRTFCCCGRASCRRPTCEPSTLACPSLWGATASAERECTSACCGCVISCQLVCRLPVGARRRLPSASTDGCWIACPEPRRCCSLSGCYAQLPADAIMLWTLPHGPPCLQPPCLQPPIPHALTSVCDCCMQVCGLLLLRGPRGAARGLQL